MSANDPVNLTDPLGLSGDGGDCDEGKFYDADPRHKVHCKPIVVTGWRWRPLQYYDDFGNGPGVGGPPNVIQLTKSCSGRAEFTAVGGQQAQSGGALREYGILPSNGTVAVDPNQFGIPYGGSAAFNIAQREVFAPIAMMVRIYSPEAGALSAQYGGPRVSSFSVGDVGDRNVRSGDILRLDIYRFPTEQQANQFGRRELPVLVTGWPLRTPCPPGTSE